MCCNTNLFNHTSIITHAAWLKWYTNITTELTPQGRSEPISEDSYFSIVIQVIRRDSSRWLPGFNPCELISISWLVSIRIYRMHIPWEKRMKVVHEQKQALIFKSQQNRCKAWNLQAAGFRRALGLLGFDSWWFPVQFCLDIVLNYCRIEPDISWFGYIIKTLFVRNL